MSSSASRFSPLRSKSSARVASSTGSRGSISKPALSRLLRHVVMQQRQLEPAAKGQRRDAGRIGLDRGVRGLLRLLHAGDRHQLLAAFDMRPRARLGSSAASTGAGSHAPFFHSSNGCRTAPSPCGGTRRRCRADRRRARRGVEQGGKRRNDQARTHCVSIAVAARAGRRERPVSRGQMSARGSRGRSETLPRNDAHFDRRPAPRGACTWRSSVGQRGLR